MIEFEPFPKIARLHRQITITEKLDGTNACVIITEDGGFAVASRTRLITPDDDNYGFARWAYHNKDSLMQLGPGRHFGEWWGQGIQRSYSLTEKRFSLFNTKRWSDDTVRPSCCHCVPVLYEGVMEPFTVIKTLKELEQKGSHAAPGFMKPEGIIVWHDAARIYFKATVEKDEEYKGKSVENSNN